MTARLISDRALFGEHRDAGRIDELCDWARANSLNPSDVAADEPITIEDTPDGRVIRCHVYMTDGSGNKLKPQGGGPEIQERTTPLVVEPPDGWPVYALTDHEEQP
mgnify:CR=1 FL=1